MAPMWQQLLSSWLINPSCNLLASCVVHAVSGSGKFKPVTEGAAIIKSTRVPAKSTWCCSLDVRSSQLHEADCPICCTAFYLKLFVNLLKPFLLLLIRCHFFPSQLDLCLIYSHTHTPFFQAYPAMINYLYKCKPTFPQEIWLTKKHMRHMSQCNELNSICGCRVAFALR